MSGLNWEPLADVQDGQVVDFEVLSSIINNSNYLKERSTYVSSKNGGTRTTNDPDYRMAIVGGVVNYSIGKNAFVDINIKYSSKTLPIVIASIDNGQTATVSTFGVGLSGAKARVYPGSAVSASKDGRVMWMAIITIDQ